MTVSLSRVEPGDVAAEPQHAVRDADRAGRQRRRQTIEDQVPVFLMLGDAEAANHPRRTGPRGRQPCRQVRMEHEALHQLRREPTQALRQPTNGLHWVAAADAQAFAG